MRIIIGSDQKHPTVDHLVETIKALGHEVIVVGAIAEEELSWVEVGLIVGRAIANREARYGVACCWTGTGVSIAANKIKGVRAALCCDQDAAKGARLYNHANVMAIGLQHTTPEAAAAILDTWLRTPNGGGEYHTQVEALQTIEQGWG